MVAHVHYPLRSVRAGDLHEFKANYMVTSRTAQTKTKQEKTNKPKFDCKLAPWEQCNLVNNEI